MLCSESFLAFIKPGSPAQGMMPPTVDWWQTEHECTKVNNKINPPMKAQLNELLKSRSR